MPTPTYTPLANITLGSSAASVTFSSISQSYRDLVLVVQAKNTTGGTGLRGRFNGDTGSNYSFVLMDGDGSSAASVAVSGQNVLSFGTNSTADNIQIINVMDYSATDKHKTVLVRANGASSSVTAFADRWANTASITTFLIFPESNSFASGSTFALYGIAA
jgi:hypothetical protein